MLPNRICIGCIGYTWWNHCLNNIPLRLQCLLTGLFWYRDQYLELIKYTNEIVLPCSEKAMHAVAEELQRFGEKGELCCHRVF